jgi:hypothetical protein
MAAPLPVGLGVLADLILRPAEEPPLLHDFNKLGGIPHPDRRQVVDLPLAEVNRINVL